MQDKDSLLYKIVSCITLRIMNDLNLDKLLKFTNNDGLHCESCIQFIYLFYLIIQQICNKNSYKRQ